MQGQGRIEWWERATMAVRQRYPESTTHHIWAATGDHAASARGRGGANGLCHRERRLAAYAVSTARSTTLALATRFRSCGAMAKTAFGVPAAAHTTAYRIRSRSR